MIKIPPTIFERPMAQADGDEVVSDSAPETGVSLPCRIGERDSRSWDTVGTFWIVSEQFGMLLGAWRGSRSRSLALAILAPVPDSPDAGPTTDGDHDSDADGK